ncbi:MAG: hypothetical protein QNK37_06805 [Acidobacteriota bacterium]|nr:hypothetical protein [Acidobacteriota bacterium]
MRRRYALVNQVRDMILRMRQQNHPEGRYELGATQAQAAFLGEVDEELIQSHSEWWTNRSTATRALQQAARAFAKRREQVVEHYDGDLQEAVFALAKAHGIPRNAVRNMLNWKGG